MLEVPHRLNRNAPKVRAMGDPADTGVVLINYMCERIGIDSLAGLDVLDFGCGVRFTQSIVNRDVPIGSYTGVEAAKEVVDFLKANVNDPRLSYLHINIANRLYNPNGERLDADEPSPLGNAAFDIICMFSVITHQQPDEAVPTFKLLRRHVRPHGHLFFSAFIHTDDVPHQDLSPKRPGVRSSYSLPFMMEILADARWSVTSVAAPGPNGAPIATSFLCTP